MEGLSDLLFRFVLPRVLRKILRLT